MTPSVDFLLRDEGTIWLFTPLTPAALQFLSEHIQGDPQYFGDSLAVEHRYVSDLIVGLREHDLGDSWMKQDSFGKLLSAMF
jgi:hypothetical protein